MLWSERNPAVVLDLGVDVYLSQVVKVLVTKSFFLTAGSPDTPLSLICPLSSRFSNPSVFPPESGPLGSCLGLQEKLLTLTYTLTNDHTNVHTHTYTLSTCHVLRYPHTSLACLPHHCSRASAPFVGFANHALISLFEVRNPRLESLWESKSMARRLLLRLYRYPTFSSD